MSNETLDLIRPSRRTMVRGAAWSVPVVAIGATAPAFAASPCDAITRTVDWGNTAQYSRTNDTSAKYTVPDPDGSGPAQALTLTISTTTLGSNVQTGAQSNNTSNDNLTRFTGQMGGSSTTANHLTLHQSPVRDRSKTDTLTDANRSITRFTFSRAVATLTFTLSDIDSATDDFWDAIALVTDAGGSVSGTIVNTNRVTGAGTTSSPWKASSVNVPAGGNSTAGNVNVTMTNVTSFDLYYWNTTADWSSSVDGDQKVFLSSMSATYKPC